MLKYEGPMMCAIAWLIWAQGPVEFYLNMNNFVLKKGERLDSSGGPTFHKFSLVQKEKIPTFTADK